MAETKMICPDCGTEMNHHAEKLIEPTTAEEARRMDPELGALVEDFIRARDAARARRGPDAKRDSHAVGREDFFDRRRTA